MRDDKDVASRVRDDKDVASRVRDDKDVAHPTVRRYDLIMSRSKATTSRTAYNACHPDIPLPANDPRYVDLTPARSNQNFTCMMAEALEWTQDAPPPPYYQQLVTGHRGCGNSTEFFRLQAELEERGFFPVYFDVTDSLDLDDLNYLDVLLSIASEVIKQVNIKGIRIDKDFLQDLYAWFAEKATTKERSSDMKAAISTEASAGSELPFVAKFFATLTRQVRVGSSQKDEIRLVLRRELSVFLQRLNDLLAEVRCQVQAFEKPYKDLVVIVDGMEIMAFDMRDGKSTHEILFVQNAEQLSAPHCHLIYTVPISLAYDANLSNAFGLDMITVIPMVNTKIDEGMNTLRDVVAQRLDIEHLFVAPELLDQLIAMSGGAVRDLMRLIRIACQTSTHISQADVTRAINNLSIEYGRFLRDDDLKALQRVEQTQQAPGSDPAYGRLLHLRVLHEYLNGSSWADIHPLVRRIKWVNEALNEAHV